MEATIWSCNFCWIQSWMPQVLWNNKSTKWISKKLWPIKTLALYFLLVLKDVPYSCEGHFLHVIRHLWKLQLDNVVFVEFSQACPKLLCINKSTIWIFAKIQCNNGCFFVFKWCTKVAFVILQKTICVWKIWFFNYKWKCSRPVSLEDF